ILYGTGYSRYCEWSGRSRLCRIRPCRLFWCLNENDSQFRKISPKYSWTLMLLQKFHPWLLSFSTTDLKQQYNGWGNQSYGLANGAGKLLRLKSTPYYIQEFPDS